MDNLNRTYAKASRTEKGAAKLQISFPFHHVQLDGLEACCFLEQVQKNIFSININEHSDAVVSGLATD